MYFLLLFIAIVVRGGAGRRGINHRWRAAFLNISMHVGPARRVLLGNVVLCGRGGEMEIYNE